MSIAEKLIGGVAERRAAAWALYWEILLRGNQPDSGDEAALRECVATLGLDMRDLAQHAGAVRELESLRAQSAELDEAADDNQAACEAYGQVEQWAAAEREKLDAEIETRLSKARARWDAAGAAAKNAMELRGAIASATARIEALRRSTPAERRLT